MGEWMSRFTFSWPRHLKEVSGQIHTPAVLLPGKEPLVLIGLEAGWVSRAGLEDMETWQFLTLPELEHRPFGRPTPSQSQSLYRLHYRGRCGKQVLYVTKSFSFFLYQDLQPFCWAQASLSVPYTQSVVLLGKGISPSQEHTHIHASSGIRTHDLSVGADEDSSCLRPRGHCDRLKALFH
jgi:hypothetical protein